MKLHFLTILLALGNHVDATRADGHTRFFHVSLLMTSNLVLVKAHRRIALNEA